MFFYHIKQAWSGVKLAESCGLKNDHPRSNPINNKSVWPEAISCSIKIHRYSVTCSPAPCLCPLCPAVLNYLQSPLCILASVSFYFFSYKLWQFFPCTQRLSHPVQQDVHMAQRADEILATHCNSLHSCSHILCAAPHPNGRDTPLNTPCMLQDHMHGRTVTHCRVLMVHLKHLRF